MSDTTALFLFLGAPLVACLLLAASVFMEELRKLLERQQQEPKASPPVAQAAPASPASREAARHEQTPPA